ncbi:MAG TPA: hypothetical protein VNL17_15435 [Verrucomicrobiae bacterium]|nr:hypothetical protein [Verrucomicrobiae bacterium]
MRSLGGGTGGSVRRALARVTAGSTGFHATPGNNATGSTGNTTWNFTTITMSLLGPFSPHREARNEHPDFV